MSSDSDAKRELRFILIEDSPFDAELIEMNLRETMPCHVVVVGTREDFLSELNHARPDVIISDSNLPAFDGFAALTLAKQFCPEVPFVFCSGIVPPETKAKALSLGANNWVSKDFLDQLVACVQELSENRAGDKPEN